jgi:hypothetical protein
MADPLPWRTVTAQTYVDNADLEGFDEARIMCPDGRLREVWDAGYDVDGDVIVIRTAMPNEFAVTLTAPILVR